MALWDHFQRGSQGTAALARRQPLHQSRFPRLEQGQGRWIVSSERGRVPSGKFGGNQSRRPPGSRSGARDLLRRVLGRAGPACSASSRRRDRDCGLRAALLSLVTSVLAGTVERHSKYAFSRRLWLSGSRAGGTRQSGSPGRGPQAASQAPWSARTASRSRHRSSGVTQCGWAGVPPVIASSAAASWRASGGFALVSE